MLQSLSCSSQASHRHTSCDTIASPAPPVRALAKQAKERHMLLLRANLGHRHLPIRHAVENHRPPLAAYPRRNVPAPRAFRPHSVPDGMSLTTPRPRLRAPHLPRRRHHRRKRSRGIAGAVTAGKGCRRLYRGRQWPSLPAPWSLPVHLCLSRRTHAALGGAAARARSCALVSASVRTRLKKTMAPDASDMSRLLTASPFLLRSCPAACPRRRRRRCCRTGFGTRRCCRRRHSLRSAVDLCRCRRVVRRLVRRLQALLHARNDALPLGARGALAYTRKTNARESRRDRWRRPCVLPLDVPAALHIRHGLGVCRAHRARLLLLHILLTRPPRRRNV